MKKKPRLCQGRWWARVCVACAEEETLHESLMNQPSDPAPHGGLSTEFEPIMETIRLSIAANKDCTAYLWPLGVSEDGFHWSVHVFMQADWHPEFPGPDSAFLIARPCTLTQADAMAGITTHDVTRRALEHIERLVAQMNASGSLFVLDTIDGYTGPKIARGVRLVPQPTYGQRLVEAALLGENPERNGFS
jgi:hypothetical protein